MRKVWSGSRLQVPKERYPMLCSLTGGARAFASYLRCYAASEAHSAAVGAFPLT